MASIEMRKNKQGEITGYRLRACVGRDEQYKQVWRTTTIKRPEGLTPAKEKKKVESLAYAWETAQKAEYKKTHSKTGTDKGKITLEAFVREHWWPDYVMDGKHTPSSISFFDFMSADIISYFAPQKQPLSEIDTESVKRYINFLNNTARTKQGKPYSATTIKHHFSTLRNILRYAQRIHYIQTDPCQDLSKGERPHLEAKKIDFLVPDEATRFIKCLDLKKKDPSDLNAEPVYEEPLFWRALMNLLIICGLRRGEAIALQWQDIDDIDPNKPKLIIRRNVTIDKSSTEKYRVGKTKTRLERIVPISTRIYGLLMELKDEQTEELQVTLVPNNFIFCRAANPQKPIYPTEPTRWLRKFIKRHNLPNVSPHDLRHTAASLALEAGSNMKQVQDLLGHQDPQTTMKFYAGVTEEAQRRTVESIEDLIV